MSNARSKAPDEPIRVVINDACCLIDLNKVGLIEVMLRLPHRFVVALPVRENELLDFNKRDWRRMQTAGLEVIDLDGAQVGRAFKLRSNHSKLSAEDCFSLVLAQDMPEPILLTGDATLRLVAQANGLQVHGVLWVTEQLFRHKVCAPARLVRCLNEWLEDPLVHLPATAIHAQMKAFGRK